MSFLCREELMEVFLELHGDDKTTDSVNEFGERPLVRPQREPLGRWGSEDRKVRMTMAVAGTGSMHWFIQKMY
jgi:hypothetical protein